MKDTIVEFAALVWAFLMAGVLIILGVVLFATPVALFIWVVYLILKALGVFA
ncbi:hypothetical protein [Parasutterella excrementihominis]|uniref:hypothetical protein n=1 Tax=Parasutterella excrementihominis TaxID=487175 RepID=UPI0022E0CF15|nr:hypothetical protein [Parasutterella excrementihominis]